MTSPFVDGDMCTQDQCSPTEGCTHASIASSCDDRDICTSDSCEPEVGCINRALNCSDGNACTSDILHTPLLSCYLVLTTLNIAVIPSWDVLILGLFAMIIARAPSVSHPSQFSR